MFEIKGLDKLSQQLEQVTDALDENDGQLGALSFNPHDAASIEAAIQESERLVDEKTSLFPSNPLLQNLGEQMKERYRQAIIDRAAQARLDQSSDENDAGN